MVSTPAAGALSIRVNPGSPGVRGHGLGVRESDELATAGRAGDRLARRLPLTLAHGASLCQTAGNVCALADPPHAGPAELDAEAGRGYTSPLARSAAALREVLRYLIRWESRALRTLTIEEWRRLSAKGLGLTVRRGLVRYLVEFVIGRGFARSDVFSESLILAQD
jgi:hypothetical protein